MRMIGVVGLLAAVAAGCAPRQLSGVRSLLERAEARAARSEAAARVALIAEDDLIQPAKLEADREGQAADDLLWTILGDSTGPRGRDDQAASSEAAAPGTRRAAIPWRKRRGPAYPGDFWYSFGRFGKEMPATLWDDTKATFTNRFSLATLAVAGLSGAYIASSDLDHRVERHYNKHGSQLSTEWDSVEVFGGSPALHFPLAGTMLIGSLAGGYDETYEKSKTLLNALALNGLLTQGLKWAARTESPNGDELGWPSGHSSSSFCFATVMLHEYGPWIGVPMLAFAGFVAYERVDARNHDFSDVVSGSLIGIAIGHAVARNHQDRLMGIEIAPYVDTDRGEIGIMLVKRW